MAVDRQRAQKTRDLGGPHLGGVAFAVEEDVAADPRDVRRFRAPAVMAKARGGADAIEKTRSNDSRGIG